MGINNNTQPAQQMLNSAYELAAQTAKEAHLPLFSDASGTCLLKDSQQLTRESAYRQHLNKAIAGFSVVAVAVVAAVIFNIFWIVTIIRVPWVVLMAAGFTAEAIYCCWFVNVHAPHLNKQPSPHIPQTVDSVLHFRRLLALSRFNKTTPHPVDFREYAHKWFKSCHLDDIRMRNVEEMICYGFFYKTRSQVESEGHLAVVQEMVQLLGHEGAPNFAKDMYIPEHIKQQIQEALSNQDQTNQPAYSSPSNCGNGQSGGLDHPVNSCPDGVAVTGLEESTAADAAAHCPHNNRIIIRPGYTPGLDFMGHLWEPLKWHYRPLIVYVVLEVLQWCVWGCLKALGFKSFVVDGTRFYCTPGNRAQSDDNDDDEAKQLPMLLCHGVGAGLLPYLLLVVRLVSSGHPLCAPSIKHISMRITRDIPAASDIAIRCIKAMDRLGWKDAAVIAHSYGTFVASCMAQKNKDRIRALTLIDPVCFGMFLPRLLHNFVYATPIDNFREKGWRSVKTMIANLFLHFISRDIHLAATFCRGFYWTDVNLWPEDVPGRSLIVLAGNDELLHAENVREVFTSDYSGVPARPDGQLMTLQDLEQDWQPVIHEHLLMKTTGAAISHSISNHHSSSTPGGRVMSTMASRKSDPGLRKLISAVDTQPTDRSQLRVLYSPGVGHAAFLVNSSWQAEVMEQILSLAEGEATQDLMSRRNTTMFTPEGLVAPPTPPRSCVSSDFGNANQCQHPQKMVNAQDAICFSARVHQRTPTICMANAAEPAGVADVNADRNQGMLNSIGTSRSNATMMTNANRCHATPSCCGDDDLTATPKYGHSITEDLSCPTHPPEVSTVGDGSKSQCPISAKNMLRTAPAAHDEDGCCRFDGACTGNTQHEEELVSIAAALKSLISSHSSSE